MPGRNVSLDVGLNDSPNDSLNVSLNVSPNVGPNASLNVSPTDAHQAYCQRCLDGGDLVLCDYCPAAYHLPCAGLAAADLRRLKLWAPRLESLNLQACYSIGGVTLLERRPARPAGPLYQFEGEPSEFTVNCMNTRVPKGNLVTSRRCREVIKNSGDDLF